MNKESEYKGSFHKDVKEWLIASHRDNVEILEYCERNANAIANLLKRNIRISKGFVGRTSIPDAFLSIFTNSLSRYDLLMRNRQAENTKLFYIRTKDDINQVLERYDKFVSVSKQIKDVYTFKLSDYTKFDGKDGLSEKDLGYGAIINLQARSYTYENKFGKGTSASLDGIYIVEAAKNTVMNNISE